MKQSEAVAKFIAGEDIFIGEYRQSIAEIIHWRDKDTGKAMSGPVLRHRVEKPRDTVTVIERVDDKFVPSSYRSAFERGQKVVVHFSSMNALRGNVEYRGVIEPLEKT
jgi:hypothetical protein